ncbi:MAG: hypothetical protein Q7R73_00665 [bacterium]|nr:hypothetical protein [bacterium]
MENVQENIEKDAQHSYQHYKELGGIINEKDYQSALDRAKNIMISDNEFAISQVNVMARTSGITLHNSKDASDQRIILYGILRTDFKSKEEAEYHHADMSNQKLFAEVLRMLGDEDSLKKLIEAHPHIFDSTNK